MRREIISCNNCCATHDAQYQLPRAWITTTQGDTSYVDTEQHFCSFKCLIDWAQKCLIESKPKEEPVEYVDPHKEPLFSEAVKELIDYVGPDNWRDV